MNTHIVTLQSVLRQSDSDKESLIKESIKKMSTALYLIADALDDDDSYLSLSLKKVSLDFTKAIHVDIEKILTDITSTQSMVEIVTRLGYISTHIEKVLLRELYEVEKYILVNKNVPRISAKKSKYKEHIKDEVSHVLERTLTKPKKTQPKLAPTKKEIAPKKTFAEKTIFADHQYRTKKINLETKRTIPARIENSLVVQPKELPKVPSSKKTGRQERLINILTATGATDIRTIGESFPGMSLKTIQRDLNELINEGRVAREGDRRWARYSLVS